MTLELEIDHVQIAIPKGGETQGRAFFGGILYLIEIPKPLEMAARGGCWFAAGQHQIHLGIDDDFRAAKKAHLALITNELDELRARLVAAGYKTVNDSDVEGRMRFFTHDPFGNRIEFMDRTSRT